MASEPVSALMYEVEKSNWKRQKNPFLLPAGKTRKILMDNMKVSYDWIVKYKSIKKPI